MDGFRLADGTSVNEPTSQPASQPTNKLGSQPRVKEGGCLTVCVEAAG